MGTQSTSCLSHTTSKHSNQHLSCITCCLARSLTVEKKFVKGILDEIEKAKPQTVRFENLEAIASGPHKDYLSAICGGLSFLIDSLSAKNIQVIGTVHDPYVLPWNLVAKIDKNFKGLPAPGESTPP